ncbi:8679_t:CDS:10 [Ambispora leptoticha]|uniref:8679_t:CDS:1 n=1 Tax=Ambispora leptoticha TaxID=144679 RepID=A0A9N8VIR9_9GLOM|nr:8679_t:CDS:10 [Ambispora leptoticha]
MYTATECIENPLGVVKKLFDAHKGSTNVGIGNDYEVSKNFKNVFATEETIKLIPSINDICADNIPSNTLVRFRCMIQNTGLGHEMYLNVFETFDSSGTKRRLSSRNNSNVIKKKPNDDDSVEDLDRLAANLNLFYDEQKHLQDHHRRQLEKSYVASKFPFPDESHVSAIVKVYEKNDSLKVGDVIEFIGVLEHFTWKDSGNNDEFNPSNDFIDPTLLLRVPRLHAIFYRKLHQSSNPLISEMNLKNTTLKVQEAARGTRNSLIQYIASAFAGDLLVAEFVLLQLLSRIYNRRDGITLGKFGINITNIPSLQIDEGTSSSETYPLPLSHTNLFTRNVATILSSVLTKYHDLPLTLSTLNNVFFYPRCDGVLDSGVFQVSDGTFFLVDETVLKEGTLGDTGVRNMQTLTDILNTQKLNYLFPFNKFQFNIDIGLIILSTAKSFFPADCVIPLKPLNTKEAMPLLSEETLTEFRKYISIMRYSDYSISESISEFVQDDFVKQRQIAARNGRSLMTPDDLFLQMNLARLITLSFGETELTTEIWEYTQKLEHARKELYYAGIIPSRFFKTLVGQDWYSFKSIVALSIAVTLSAALAKSLVKFMGGLFALTIRRILTIHMQRRYVQKNTFYPLLTNLTNIDNPDQRIVQDIDKFAETLRLICEVILISPIIIAYYTYLCCRFFIAPIVNLVFMKEYHEGNFRYLHVRIRQFAESIAFSGGERAEVKSLDSRLRSVLYYQRKIIDKELSLQVITDSFAYFGSVLSYLLIAIPIFSQKYEGIGKDELSRIISLNAFMSMYLIYRFTVIVQQSSKLSDLAGYTARIGQLMEAISDINNELDNVNIDFPAELAIEFENVTISSPTGTVLISDLKFVIEQEKNVMIIGPNGSGKTSILRVMSGLWPVTRGCVVLPQKNTRQKVLMYLPQTPYLVFGSLRDQIIYPMTSSDKQVKITDDEIRSLLSLVNLSHIESVVRSFDIKYGQDWERMLTPGEQQKLAFARLFFWKPVFAGIDEASSALDSNTEAQFFETCKEYGITCITVSHNKNLLQFHEKVLLLDGKGRYATSDIDINGSKDIERWIEGTLKSLS